MLKAWLALSVPCLAITPTATPPAPRSDAPQKWANPQTAKATRDDSSGLRKGTIEAVSLGGGTFHVYGQRLTFDTKQVKVYGRDVVAQWHLARIPGRGEWVKIAAGEDLLALAAAPGPSAA